MSIIRGHVGRHFGPPQNVITVRPPSRNPAAGVSFQRRFPLQAAVAYATAQGVNLPQLAFVLEPTPPYDFALTAGYATHFERRYAAESFEEGVYRRLLDLGGRPALAEARSAGGSDAPRVAVELRGDGLHPADADLARAQLARLLGAEDDVRPFYEMAHADDLLAPLVKGLHGLHVPQAASVYEALTLTSIIGQQISAQVARVLRGLIIETFGRRAEFDGESYWAFPRPEAVAAAGIDDLRALKLSQRKAEYVLGVSKRVASGDLDLEGLRGLPPADVVERLTAIRGVGPWTAHWLLISALGETDGFPSGDLALQRTMGRLVNEGPPMPAAEALAYSERWSPHRSHVTTYLFASTRAARVKGADASGPSS